MSTGLTVAQEMDLVREWVEEEAPPLRKIDGKPRPGSWHKAEREVGAVLEQRRQARIEARRGR